MVIWNIYRVNTFVHKHNITRFVLKPAGFKTTLSVFLKSWTKRLRATHAQYTHTGVFTHSGWLGLNTWNWVPSINLVFTWYLLRILIKPLRVSTVQFGVWELRDLRKPPVQFNRKRHLISQNDQNHLCGFAWPFSLVWIICWLKLWFLSAL